MIILQNQIFMTALAGWLAAQIIKCVINTLQTKKFSLEILFSSGGMPSSHTAIAVAMATKVGIVEGFDSTFFAIAAVFSCVVIYDAMGVRRQAGKHAQIINILTKNWPSTPNLKELLGHKPIEVVFGVFLGIAVAFISAI
ncbi:MAG: divergent PAP2 family protein [Defluviitaleaceae bacterium]|nr:divergent PAP2 family protein [Defluviitaleaceae bacterium]